MERKLERKTGSKIKSDIGSEIASDARLPLSRGRFDEGEEQLRRCLHLASAAQALRTTSGRREEAPS
eukprot:6206144-Pleurochrysis_carterae.AAC.2